MLGTTAACSGYKYSEVAEKIPERLIRHETELSHCVHDDIVPEPAVTLRYGRNAILLRADNYGSNLLHFHFHVDNN